MNVHLYNIKNDYIHQKVEVASGEDKCKKVIWDGFDMSCIDLHMHQSVSVNL